MPRRDPFDSYDALRSLDELQNATLRGQVYTMWAQNGDVVKLLRLVELPSVPEAMAIAACEVALSASVSDWDCIMVHALATQAIQSRSLGYASTGWGSTAHADALTARIENVENLRDSRDAYLVSREQDRPHIGTKQLTYEWLTTLTDTARTYLARVEGRGDESKRRVIVPGK